MKDAAGEVVELRCTYDPATRGGNAPDGRKVKATIHWVVGRQVACPPKSGSTTRSSPGPIRARTATVRRSQPELAGNAAGRADRAGARARPTTEQAIQFERQGYFCRDPDRAPASRCSTAPLACATATRRHSLLAHGPYSFLPATISWSGETRDYKSLFARIQRRGAGQADLQGLGGCRVRRRPEAAQSRRPAADLALDLPHAELSRRVRARSASWSSPMRTRPKPPWRSRTSGCASPTWCCVRA